MLLCKCSAQPAATCTDESLANVIDTHASGNLHALMYKYACTTLPILFLHQLKWCEI